MAAKKPKAPKKFKQARSAAKADAKAAFNGKVQARRKDITGKLTAEDKQVLREVSKESRAGIITGPDGKSINVGKPTETAAERFDREGRQAREAFRSKMRAEFGTYGGKAATPLDLGEVPSTPAKSAAKAAPAKAAKTKATAPKATKPVAETAAKPSVKPATKGYAAGKELNAAGQARYDELIKQGVKPKSALNKALFAQEKAAGKPTAKATESLAKPKVNKPKVTKTGAGIAEGGELKTADQVATYKDAVKRGIPKGEAMRIAQGKATATKATGTDVAVRAKGTVAAKGKEVAVKEADAVKGAAAKAGRFGRLKGIGKAGLYGGLAAEAVSAVKGSSEKDFKEIQRLENKLAALQGKAPKYKNMGSNKNPLESMKADASTLASLSTFGLIGKTRRERMDELNAKIDKAQAKKNKAIAAARAAKPGILPGSHVSSSKIEKTYTPKPGAPSVGAGGSTIKPAQGSTYVVTKGDTLSGIAKAAGVSLSDIHAANPIFKKNAKYKQGNMIWSGTKVKIPTIQK